ncbi:Voltage-dependent T-type calcium channel subunit alpha-1I [Tupaia chinensis]|uniref:Voltage-dependent T-type calcium channel subunit alpha-1I n=1 Tax=Tupaia chinensis TaxID=246437 RepID=L9KNF1_TUPCH|nr:Voltage-dependent T-type calcium channel subunit alpha-1I [Tupaia chinensis]
MRAHLEHQTTPGCGVPLTGARASYGPRTEWNRGARGTAQSCELGPELSADMAESASPPSSPAAALATEQGVTEQPGPQSPPPSPPGLEEPLDGADPDVPHPDLAPVAFFCLRQTTSPRNWCIKMVCNPYPFMLVILLTCVTLGMYQPCDDMDCLSDRCKILQVFDDFIFIFFAMEMVLKMVALGIFGKKCYLGDTWNRLDFFIVMAGMVEYSLDLQNINLSAIRTVRVLRPLKAINRVPSMRILVNLLLDTLPMLGNVLLLCFFVFFIFGIIGVQLWAGLLRNRCFLEENFTIQGDVALPPYYQPEEDDEMPFICSLSGDNGIMGCHEIPPLKEQGRECCLSKDDVYDFGAARQDLNASGLCVNWNRYYNVCRTGSANPHKGAINFDNIGYAWIVIFQVITLEGWVEIMYYVMDAHSFYNFIYFILLIICSGGLLFLLLSVGPSGPGTGLGCWWEAFFQVGSFFMINLCLVVIATQFSETKQREHRLMLEQRQRYLSSSTVASYAEPGDCYEELLQYPSQAPAPPPGPPPGPAEPAPGCAPGGHCSRQARGAHRGAQALPSRFLGLREWWESGSLASAAAHPPSVPAVQAWSWRRPSARGLAQHVDEHEADRRPSGLGSTDSGQEGSGSGGLGACEDEADGDRAQSSEDGASSGLGKEDAEERADGASWLCGDLWREARAKLRGIVDSKYFNRGIMMAILVNTVSMGIEHHEQASVAAGGGAWPEELTNILEICNVVFTSMFALEMILKLAAFGLFDYLRNPYNIFDSIIVIISIWEIVGQADGGLSVLRTFRLLRVLKLVRFLPGLRRQLVVLMKTMDNVATFCMLLMLFIFIFSILGMHIFGCKFSLRTDTGDTVPDRKNFDSLLWAIVTVFQILTQEDWNVVLYNGMASTSPWASLYFVALMTFGNYVLFNLLVAILVEGFQAEGDANRSYSDEDQSSSNMEEFDKLPEGLDSGADPKLCPIPLTPNGHLDPSFPLGGHLGPTGPAAPTPRLSLQPDPLLMALSSRKSSVMSLGRLSYDQRSLLPELLLRAVGPQRGLGQPPLQLLQPQAQAAMTSLKHKLPSAEHESLLSAERGGGCGARAGEGVRDEGPLRTAPLHASHAHHSHHGSHLSHRHRHHRRTLSLDTRDSVDLVELVPTVGPHPRAAWRAAGLVPGHEDCNGRMPSIAKDVFTKMDDRRDRGEDDEEIDYTLCFRVRKMIDVYKPDWCEIREDWSVYLFSPENRFRVLCQTVIAHKLFDYVVLAFIFLNCITIALERPQIEAGSTVVSLGLYFGEQAYLRSSWNVLDGFLVFVSIIDIVVSVASAGGAKILGVLRVLRLLRTLRPLRVISRAPGLKLVVETLISSLKPIGNIVLICCAFFIIFGILGVQLFKGKFYHCLGVDTRNITNRSDCVAANYRWVHHKYNFDNLGQEGQQLFMPWPWHRCTARLTLSSSSARGRLSLLSPSSLPSPHLSTITPPLRHHFASPLSTLASKQAPAWFHFALGQACFIRQCPALMSLFVLASKDGWVNIMYNGLDAVAVDQQPVTNHNPWMLLYFISFLLIVSFFVLNMFVGVVVENFHKCRQHQEAEEARRREEKRLRRLEKKRRKAQRLPYYATYCPTRLLIHSMCTSHYLDIFITFIICLNVVTMSLEHYNQPTSLETALKYCNYLFTTVFVLEAVLKLVAFGLRRFFKDRWNQLDLAIVLLSVMGITLEEIEINAALPINPTIIRIMRVLRIARVLKLLKMATGMRALLDTVVQALPQVGNLGLLFMLLFFIYAALGVELFGKLVCDDENPCEGMSRHATFENFGMAFLTLFFFDTLRDCTHDERSCLSSLQFVSPLYFVSFVLTAQFVLINVVVAVLMKHLDDSNKEAQEDAEMDAELELEMAHTLGPSPGPRPPASSPGAPENLWLDSVSLIIKDSLDGELTIIDNLSGSIFHHYSSPAGCDKCHHDDKQEVQLAETEAFSLNSDRSSSILLGDDLSLEDPTACPPGPKDSKGEPDPPEPVRVGDLGECFFPLPNTAVPSGPENFLHEMETIPFHPVRSWLKSESGQVPPRPFSPEDSSPLLPMPAEFFHPAVSASQKGQEKGTIAGALPKIALQGSWASLRSPSVNCTLLRQPCRAAVCKAHLRDTNRADRVLGEYRQLLQQVHPRPWWFLLLTDRPKSWAAVL